MSSGSSRSSGSSGSSRSSGSTDTHLGYSAKIAEIRETREDEAANGKTVYIRREDGDEELVSSVWECSAYTYKLSESILTLDRPPDYWKAYNTIAKWILSGRIRLSGGRDCFKRLANAPQAGVGTLDAGNGIFFAPGEDVDAFGTIYPRAHSDRLTKAHISSPIYDAQGQPTNSITLLRRTRYLIAGDNSDSDTMTSDVPDVDRRPELMICHRGTLREAGFEIPGPIGRQDLWLLDTAGKWHGTQPMQCRKTCSGCLRSYANRKWATSDVCEGLGHCDNAVIRQVGTRGRERGYIPALAEVECAGSLMGFYRGPRDIFSMRPVRDLEKVLDGRFAVHGWDHLSEMTRHNDAMLALLFCSVPSLGERLKKKGACFVPWASESGITLGDYFKIRALALNELFIVLGATVIEKHTGLSIKFEEDNNGVTHVERGSEDSSDRLPEGVSGYVCLGR